MLNFNQLPSIYLILPKKLKTIDLSMTVVNSNWFLQFILVIMIGSLFSFGFINWMGFRNESIISWTWCLKVIHIQGFNEFASCVPTLAHQSGRPNATPPLFPTSIAPVIIIVARWNMPALSLSPSLPPSCFPPSFLSLCCGKVCM